jgi:pectate lyase
VSGAITFEPKGTGIRVKSHKTIVGLGANATIVQGGFMLEVGVHNVIIRNLTIRDSFVEGDLEGKTQATTMFNGHRASRLDRSLSPRAHG